MDITDASNRCPINMNIPAPKLWALQIDPMKQNYNFLRKGSTYFDRISVIFAYHLPKQNCTDSNVK
jgi:hypothetical protein